MYLGEVVGQGNVMVLGLLLVEIVLLSQAEGLGV